MSTSSGEQVSGSVERITYYNEENGYTVLRLNPDAKGMLPFKYASGRDALITVVGNLPEVNPGEWLKLIGRWVSHPKHGRQFQAEHCEQSLPATTEGIKRYLGSGLIRGVGPVMAERIVRQYGDQTLDVIELEPGRLREVLGIGKKRVDGIVKAWEEQRAIKDVMIFLQSHGVSTNLATKIYKKYGDASLAVVQNEPYRMVKDIYGVGFKTADRIARATGLSIEDPGRIEAGIAYTLTQMAEDGHVYMPQESLEPQASEILGVPIEKVAQVINQLEVSEFIKREALTGFGNSPGANATAAQSSIAEERAVYLSPLYFSEIGLTRRLRRLIDHPTSRLRGLQSPRFNKELSGGRTLKLTDQQADAIRTAVSKKITILTGGPGTGKTTTLRTLLELLDEQRYSYALASPTGRAAKRLAEATGRAASTIHRLLEFRPGEGFGRDESNPLNVDMVVIDETSMLDLVLANNLFKAISPDSHVLLVGDVDQLPSVGAGDVLRDLIDSEMVAITRLETVFRQASDSLIILNAHRINSGQMPIMREGSDDFFVFVKQDPEEAAELLVDIVENRVPMKFGLDAMDDVQVLSPMYNGAAGVNNLNRLLQSSLNPPSSRRPERRLNGRLFRVGDKVMQTVNNYDKDVFNGDIGRVTSMDLIQQTMTVNIDGAPVIYDFLESDELVHAFAISVHKSQGAEYPCVVIPVLTQHYMMLQRNLLYTAVTRARRLAVLVGTRRAIGMAVKNNKVSQRYTALDRRLRSN